MSWSAALGGGLSLPHEWASDEWREQWRGIMSERDARACQQAGPRGPPFARDLPLGGFLRRWLPWNWYSIDGTGWCYDSEWDEMERCAELDAPVDWNGVSQPAALQPAGDLAAPHLRHALLLAACVSGLLAASAYWEWRTERLATSTSKAEPSLALWLRSGRAVPWRWHRPSLLAAGGAALGALLGATIAVPLNWSEPELFATSNPFGVAGW